MKVFAFDGSDFFISQDHFDWTSVLPDNAIMLDRTPFTLDHHQWSDFYIACLKLQRQIGSVDWVFVNAAWDPFRLSADQIQLRRSHLQEIFLHSKICVLSGKAQHFYDNIVGCAYVPLFLMIHYPNLVERPRAGRIGCLNRRNAQHRVWLMHHLLEQQLIDAERDCYSVRFTNIFTNSHCDVDRWANVDWFNAQQIKYEPWIATHPDNFPVDYSIEHPAWHTGIAIITETEPGVDTIVCEKTAKGILSKSCFSVYMGHAGYTVLEDLGFQPRFFDSHAENTNIQPILDICRNIATESQAMEYRQNHIKQIQHNFDWFGFQQGSFDQRPWWPQYQPKLSQALDSL